MNNVGYLVLVNKISEFVKAVDEAFLNLCGAAEGSEATFCGTGAVRYYNVEPGPVSVWISCQMAGGNVTATVCNDDKVLTSPKAIAKRLVSNARWRIREDGNKPGF